MPSLSVCTKQVLSFQCIQCIIRAKQWSAVFISLSSGSDLVLQLQGQAVRGQSSISSLVTSNVSAGGATSPEVLKKYVDMMGHGLVGNICGR